MTHENYRVDYTCAKAHDRGPSRPQTVECRQLRNHPGDCAWWPGPSIVVPEDAVRWSSVPDAVEVPTVPWLGRASATWASGKAVEPVEVPTGGLEATLAGVVRAFGVLGAPEAVVLVVAVPDVGLRLVEVAPPIWEGLDVEVGGRVRLGEPSSVTGFRWLPERQVWEGYGHVITSDQLAYLLAECPEARRRAGEALGKAAGPPEVTEAGLRVAAGFLKAASSSESAAPVRALAGFLAAFRAAGGDDLLACRLAAELPDGAGLGAGCGDVLVRGPGCSPRWVGCRLPRGHDLDEAGRSGGREACAWWPGDELEPPGEAVRWRRDLETAERGE